MAFLERGEFSQARLAFQTVIRRYEGDAAEPLAYWAMALSFYEEGGYENLLLAKDQLRNYLLFYPSQEDLEGFREAAQIDIGIISMEMMRLAPDDNTRATALKNATQAFEVFLKKFPDSDLIQMASSYLSQLATLFANPAR